MSEDEFPDVRQEGGTYIATARSVPGVVGEGETELEALRDLCGALIFTLVCELEDRKGEHD